MRKPELEGTSIVLLGSFNPAIFQPRWLAAQNLIRQEEGAEAKIAVIQSEVSDFSTEWFHLQVLQSRLQLESTDPRQFGPLRDLAAGLCELLPHTPVKVVGLNRHFHIGMETESAWHAIGHTLAPKEIWTPILPNAGLRSMLMMAPLEGHPQNATFIKVEPSTKVQHGVFVQVNRELRSSEADESDNAAWVPGMLNAQWDECLRYAESVVEHLMNVMPVK